ncbi:MAG: CARDB domain-containing protein [Sandaracinaceae bacterium]
MLALAVVFVGCARGSMDADAGRATPDAGDAGDPADTGPPVDAGTDADAGLPDASVLPCTEGAPCDLTTASLLLTSANVEVGEAIEVEWQVQNAGVTPLEGYAWSLRLSVDDTIDDTDPELCAGRTEETLVAGGFDVRTASCPALDDPGTFTLGLIVDDEDEYAESDETNNTRAAPTPITIAPARPDLRAAGVVCTPDPVSPGLTISCVFDLVNAGRAPAPASTVQLRLSTDATLDGTDPLLGSCVMGSLASGSTAPSSCAGVVDAATSSGDYTVGVITDSASVVDEVDETNNVGVASLAVAAPPSADLYISQVLCTPNPIDGGDAISCMVTVVNGGTLSAAAHTVELRVSDDDTIDGADTLIASCPAMGLAAGASEMLVCGGVVPPALPTMGWRFGAIADTEDEVMEGDEANNTAFGLVDVRTGQPNLHVTAISCTPSDNVAIGGPLSCTLQIANGGRLPSGAFMSDLRLSDDGAVDSADALIATCVSSSIAPGASTSVTCAGTVPPSTPFGEYIVGGRADTAGAVTESDETDNVATVPMSVGLAELQVNSVVCTPDPVDPLQEISCRVNLANTGDRDAGAFGIELRLSNNTTISTSDALLATCSSAGIVAGGTQSVTCVATVPAATSARTWYFGVIVDRTNAVVEENDGNNIAFDAVVVDAGRPDVIVPSVSCPATRLAGGRTGCNVAFENVGQAEMPAFSYELRVSTNTIISASDPLVATCGAGAIPIGGSTTDPCTGDLPSNLTTRTYYLGVIADSADAAAESNETNNDDGYTEVAVTASPDVLATSVSCPSSVNDGSVISCSITLRNDGQAAAPSFQYQLRMSTNTVLSTADTLITTCSTGALAARTSRTVTCGGFVPVPTSGTRYFGPLVDSADVVDEGNELNNDDTISAPVTVN